MTPPSPGPAPTARKPFASARGLAQSLLRAVTVLALAALIAALRIADVPPLPTLRTAYLDLLRQAIPRGAPGAESDLVLVEIDERSLAAVGQWPWPRDTIADLVERLAAQHPRVIGLDIIFPEPDRSSPDAAAATAAGVPTRNDRRLAEALRLAPSVLAATVVSGDAGIAAPSRPPSHVELSLVDTARLGLAPHAGVLRSLDLLDQASGRTGIAAMPLTRDGVVRELPAVMLVGESVWPSFAVEILRTALAASAVKLSAASGAVTGLGVGTHQVDVDAGGNVWLRPAPAGTFTRLSAIDVLQAKSDPDSLRARIVIVGVTATALANRFVVPGGTVLSSLEVNAHLVENLMAGTYLRRPFGTAAIEIGLAILGCAGMLLLRPQRRGTRARAACGAIGVLAVLASVLAFWRGALLVDASYALACMAALYLLLLGRGIVHAHQARRLSEREREIALALAEASSRSKTTFLANMSHELRTPLNTIIGASDVIRHGVFGPVTPAKYREYADDIHRMGGRLLDLVGRVLELADVEAGKARLVETRFDVGPALHECLESLNLTERRNALPHIAVEDDSSLPELRADRGMFKQMVLSLLSNAVKFTNVHGVVRVRGDVSTEGAFRLSIADSGSGMSDEALAAVFSPFRTDEYLRAQASEGIGVGLPLTKAMIELHGGQIAIRSKAGLGTTATLTFPAVRVRTTGADAALDRRARGP